MKICTLMENTACREGIAFEHGLSFYIETGRWKILFDMGQSDAFARNAEKMGIDLKQVDIAVLSHGHYDHGGGLKTFLEINEKAPVYVSKYAFGDFRNASNRPIGLNPKLQTCERLRLVEGSIQIDVGITLLSCYDRSPIVPINSAGLKKMENGMLTADDFQHEQYLLLEEQGRRILFSGCSHRGIVNIAGWITCDTLIGGFHFVKLNPDGETVAKAAKLLAQTNRHYYTCHCTGFAQFEAMEKIMGDRLHYLSAGSILEL